MKIPLLSFVFGAFVIHQSLIVILGLVDTHVACHGVLSHKRLVQSLYRLPQFGILLNEDLRTGFSEAMWDIYYDHSNQDNL